MSMLTRELEYSGPWLGLYPDPPERPDMSRGAGAWVVPAAALEKPTGLGMDPADASTWSRPYNPQRGMFGRLHQDQAAAARKEGKR